MLYRSIVNLCLMVLFTSTASIATAKTSGNYSYALATGKEDLRRLQYLNEAVNPYSLEFLKKYIKKGDRVLDLGCGPGIMSQKIASLVGVDGSVLGVDFSKKQLALAKKIASSEQFGNLSFERASADDLSKIKGKFDVVYIRFLLIHMRNPYEVAEQVKTVLKPGGHLLVEELYGNNTIKSRPYDYRIELIKKVDNLQEEIQKSDFTIAKTYGKFLAKNGYKVIANKTSQPKLDTPSKRRNFSMGMRSLEKTLIEHNKISKRKLRSMIQRVEKMEGNKKIELHFYKMGQIAAVLT